MPLASPCPLIHGRIRWPNSLEEENVINKLRRVAVVVLGMALCSFGLPMPSTAYARTTPVAKAERNDETSLKGQLTVNGSVTLNGKRAITGTTVLNESRITVSCESGNSALVNLGKLGRIELSAGTQMIVRFAPGLISGEVLTGKAIVNNNTGVKVAVTTPNGKSSADGKEPAALSVNAQKGSRCSPLMANSGSNPGTLGVGAIAALLGGVGAAVVTTAVAVSGKDRPASFFLP